MEQPETRPEDWVEKLIRDYQDEITRGVYSGILRLDERGLNTVLREQAHACVHAFLRLYDIPTDTDLDSFLDRMRTGGASPLRIERTGNTILWEEQHEGRCMCPFVIRQVIPLTPALCVCAVHWLKALVERVVRKPVEVELLDSAAKGAQNCVFRITLPD